MTEKEDWMGLKDKLKQRAVKSPPRLEHLDVYYKGPGGEMAPVGMVTGRLACGQRMSEPPAYYRDPETEEVTERPAAIPAPFYIKLQGEYWEIPMMAADAGQKPFCDRCANQLNCLANGKGDIVTPKHF